MQPLEARRYMPTSVAIVQAGRADLATAIRDRGGWVYYAQRLGVRFDFEVHPHGFWQRESNVLSELNNYMFNRYGSWEHPGKVPSQEEKPPPGKSLLYIPSIDMLKRDGRSDIAFAIERYHDGIATFALRNGFKVAEDVVPIMVPEEWMVWSRFAAAMRSWIAIHGANGIMPTRQDLIRTGRHDLRFATYKHGGTRAIARRLQLVHAEEPVQIWLPKWLGIQAAKLGLVVNMMHDDYLPRGSKETIFKFERELASSVVGQCTRLMTTTTSNIVHSRLTPSAIRGRRKRRRAARVGKRNGWRSFADSPYHLSPEELEKLRSRYRHLPPDDIITV
ncbi:hypothetical protein FGB62_25g632 [Gracilaria domingensis]|nr:hypothetical protein FGB62_25g632 [Gracilaria domingensis]